MVWRAGGMEGDGDAGVQTDKERQDSNLGKTAEECKRKEME